MRSIGVDVRARRPTAFFSARAGSVLQELRLYREGRGRRERQRIRVLPCAHLLRATAYNSTRISGGVNKFARHLSDFLVSVFLLQDFSFRSSLRVEGGSSAWAHVSYGRDAARRLVGAYGFFGKRSEVSGDRSRVKAKAGKEVLERGYFVVFGPCDEVLGEGDGTGVAYAGDRRLFSGVLREQGRRELRERRGHRLDLLEHLRELCLHRLDGGEDRAGVGCGGGGWWRCRSGCRGRRGSASRGGWWRRGTRDRARNLHVQLVAAVSCGAYGKQRGARAYAAEREVCIVGCRLHNVGIRVIDDVEYESTQAGRKGDDLGLPGRNFRIRHAEGYARRLVCGCGRGTYGYVHRAAVLRLVADGYRGGSGSNRGYGDRVTRQACRGYARVRASGDTVRSIASRYRDGLSPPERER